MKFLRLPALAAAILGAFTTPATAEFALKEAAGDHLDILRDGKVVGRYMMAHDLSSQARREETYKPYLHVFDPEGRAPITKGPGGEFTHHRGIFIGWMKITVNGKTVDRWHMKGGEIQKDGVKVADVVHQKFSESKAGADGATLTSINHWQGSENGEVMLEEERTMAFLPAPAPAYAMIDFTSKVKAVAGDTTLDGDPEHAGLQFRPANEVDRAKTVYLYPRENADPHKDRDYPWVAESFSLDGKTYSVVYLSHPSNAKDAPISAYRNYGRFGMFFKGPVKKGETFTARARFLVIAGEMPSAEFIQKAWNDYAGKNDPTPKTTLKPADAPPAPKPKAPAKPKAK